MSQAKTPEEQDVIQAFIEKAIQEDGAPQQIHCQGQSGGDKYRLTLIASIARSGWFEPGQKPCGNLLPFVLLVPCSLAHQAGRLGRPGRVQQGGPVQGARR